MAQRINILYIVNIPSGTHNIGGAEMHVMDVVKALPDTYAISCASDDQAYLTLMSKQAGKPLNLYTFKKRGKIAGELMLIFDLWQIIKKERPTIIHLHKLRISIWGRVVARCLGIPIIISTVHGAPSLWKFGRVKNILNTILNRWSVNYFSDITIALSISERHQLIHIDRIKPEKVNVIYNGIFNHRDFLSQPRLPSKKISIISVGRLSFEKNHLMLLDAFNILAAEFPTVSLILVGDGPEWVMLEQKAQDLGIAERVKFQGEVKRIDMPRILSEADIFAMPSLWEGMPYALIEAEFAGLPVVACRIGGIPEMVEEGQGGYLVEAHDMKNFARALKKLIKNAESRQSFGIYNRGKAQELFTGERMIEKIQKLYQELLKVKKI